MFHDFEIKQLENLINQESTPEDVLELKEHDVVTNLNLIRDALFVPKHDKDIQTIRLKKLFSDDFDIVDFIKQLSYILMPPFELRIGFSFIAETSDNNLMYFFAIRERPINNDLRFIKTKHDWKNLISFLSQYSKPDLLNFVFQQNNNLNFFDKSGFRPKKLVLSTFWISKFNTAVYHNESETESDTEI